MAWMSVMNIRRLASFCPPCVIPNSRACLIEVIVSLPALASPITWHRTPVHGSRKDEKSCVANGWRTAPTTVPPARLTKLDASCSAPAHGAGVVGCEEEPRVAACLTKARTVLFAVA